MWLPGGAGAQSKYQVVVVRKSGHYAESNFSAHLLQGQSALAIVIRTLTFHLAESKELSVSY